MNIYFCSELDDGGLFCIENTYGKAKNLVGQYLGIPFIDMRARLVIKDVEERPEILELGNKLLKKYDLFYEDYEGNKFQE